MITKIKTNTREEWLAERKKSLGGSDMGAILGLSEYSSPYTVWAEKLGKLPRQKKTSGCDWAMTLRDMSHSDLQKHQALRLLMIRQRGETANTLTSMPI